jgi:hypothetical protein
MAKIKLNNNEYSIPDLVLATVRNKLVAHLGTVAGSGIKVVVGGVEYGVDASKVAGAVASLDTALSDLSGGSASEGLKYVIGGGGTYYTINGIGTCTDTDIVIPSSYEGLPVTKIYGQGFMYQTQITSMIIPESGTFIVGGAFFYCTGLTSITLPSGITDIGADTFTYCTSLTNITFNGTMAQWNAITKAANWNKDILTTFVQCTDGQVAL